MKFLLGLIYLSLTAHGLDYREGDRESRNVVDKRGKVYSLNNNEIAEVCERGFVAGWLDNGVYTPEQQAIAKQETKERIWNMKMHSSHELSQKVAEWRRAIAIHGAGKVSNHSRECTILKQAAAAWEVLCSCGDGGVQAECSSLNDWHFTEFQKWNSTGLDGRCFSVHQFRPRNF